jgi:hypothetical protein
MKVLSVCNIVTRNNRTLSLFLLAASSASSPRGGQRGLWTALLAPPRGNLVMASAFSPPPSHQHQQQPGRADRTCSPPSSGLLLSSRGGASSSAAAASTSATASSASSTCLGSAATADAETAAAAPVEIFRTDYAALPWVISKMNMDINIQDGKTLVTSELTIDRNPALGGSVPEDAPLVLDGDETAVRLLGVALDGEDLEEGTHYSVEPGRLTLLKPSAGSVLTTTVQIVPEDNTQLSGLYKSGPMYCTQCEAMGFRRITYYPDRPDNVSDAVVVFALL